MADTFGSRLIKIMADQSWKQKDLAEAVGVSNGTISNWKTDKTTPDGEDLYSLASILNVTAGYLLHGNSLVRSEISLGLLDAWDDDTPLTGDDVEIPYYKEIELAAGKGRATQVAEFSDKNLRFSLRTLKKHGVLPENAACAICRGDSMANEIRDGDAIGIDKGRREIKDGRIYAIDHAGMLRVKYLHKTPQGLRLRSHNEDKEAYPDEIIPYNIAQDEVIILGWVFWTSKTYNW